MTYMDGFVLAVPTANREAYRAHAASTVDWFRRHGALSLVECWGDDVPDGKLTSFPMAVKKEAHETVVFSWISWPDKETRDAAHRAMADNPVPEFMDMPFDGRRMIYGGFEVILDT